MVAAAAAAAAGYGLRSDGSYGPLSAKEVETSSKLSSEEDLPLVSLDELRKHTEADSLWVVYGGVVYDVTNYVAEHPGGGDTLLQAGGQDLEVIWRHYPIHTQQDITSVLQPYQVGRLSVDDAAALGDEGGPVEAAAALQAAKSAKLRSRKRLGVLVVTSWSASLWWSTRWLLRALGTILPSLVNFLADALPCSVPGFGGAAALPAEDSTTGRRHRVAVVGGGIAGSSCAYSLAKSGFDVTVYEAREQLGGNAQTATFPTADGTRVTQDLSVVYWAPEFYRNYAALLETIGVKPAPVQIPYVIHHTMANGSTEYYCPPGFESKLDTKLEPSMSPRFADQIAKYDRMVRIVGRITNVFNYGSSRPSFYPPYLMHINPCNFMGVRRCCKLFGLSDEFYDTVVQPFHGLNLTTIQIDNCPATALTILDAIVPMTKARWHYSWDTGNSQAVFKILTESCQVKLNARVRQVRPVKSESDRLWRQEVVNDKGEVETFDRVVFACPSHAALNVLRKPGWFESVFLRAVGYHDDFHRSDWRDWLESPVHQDITCLPESQRDTLLRDCAFLIDLDESNGQKNCEFTHNLGAWSPSARSAGISAEKSPMFMTQCSHKNREIDPAKTIKTFSAPRGHPDLSHRNGMITQFLNLIQGRRGVFYCSNWVAPGNGHDLSCVSGLVVAHAIGAPYPIDNPEAYRDFKDARHFMGV
jgi:predicted NAD/FAD-binding protein/cytochrome b involved in lipid metabolism